MSLWTSIAPTFEILICTYFIHKKSTLHVYLDVHVYSFSLNYPPYTFIWTTCLFGRGEYFFVKKGFQFHTVKIEVWNFWTLWFWHALYATLWIMLWITKSYHLIQTVHLIETVHLGEPNFFNERTVHLIETSLRDSKWYT